MKLTLVTTGTRGDVQPYIPLAMGFRDAGYDISIATHEPYRDFVEQHGIRFASVAGDPQQILQGEVGLQWTETGGNPLAMLSKMRELVAEQFTEMSRTMIAACEGADAILYSTLVFFIGPSLMEKHQIPGLGVFLQPINPTGEYPFHMFPRLPLGSPYNRLTYWLINILTGTLFQSMVNTVRQDMLGLPPYTSNFQQFVKGPYPIAYGYSPLVQPRPADWPPHLTVTGYWFLDQPYTPPPQFTDWLAAGEKPVYIGFGSMTNRDPEQTTDLIMEAIRQAGVRCVLLSGWAGIGDRTLPDNVYVVDNVPHDWLFPRMRAIVHHGGAGTTAYSLRAGVPSIVVPHFADQPYWASRVAQLGVAPRPIPRASLTVDALTRAIKRAIYDRPMQRQARDIGQRIQAERGVENTIRFFQDYVLKHPSVHQ